MALTSDIVATYRRPRAVFARIVDMGEKESFALVILVAACAVSFIAGWPGRAREAYETGAELNSLLAAALMAWIMAPLAFYVIAAATRVLAMPLRGQGTWYRSRLALFWSWLAASPLQLLWGLTIGFIGEGLEADIVGIVWIAVFLWFWLACLSQAEGFFQGQTA